MQVPLIVKLAELYHLYEVMTQERWENKSDVVGDEWVIRRLREYDCASRSEVKTTYNDLAVKLGHKDKLIP
jgi:hypothetical protein